MFYSPKTIRVENGVESHVYGGQYAIVALEQVDTKERGVWVVCPGVYRLSHLVDTLSIVHTENAGGHELCASSLCGLVDTVCTKLVVVYQDCEDSNRGCATGQDDRDYEQGVYWIFKAAKGGLKALNGMYK
jgi:hypothetical protein